MLFSSEYVSRYINQTFEPVWVSVRPVPMITVDFGDGNIVRRTLHGNVATYVCDHNGHVLDVLPGIYEPDVWVDQLAELVTVHTGYLEACKRVGNNFLHAYHEERIENLAGDGDIESTIAINSSYDDILAADTRINESARRQLIHEHLATAGLVAPDEIKGWLYREVLHADLDDPWLGLGPALFANYPFAEEDAR